MRAAALVAADGARARARFGGAGAGGGRPTGVNGQQVHRGVGARRHASGPLLVLVPLDRMPVPPGRRAPRLGQHDLPVRLARDLGPEVEPVDVRQRAAVDKESAARAAAARPRAHRTPVHVRRPLLLTRATNVAC